MIRSRFLLTAVLSIALAGSAAAAVSESLWVPRGTETYNLEPGESVQFMIEFEDLQVRAWILEVDGDQRLCDLNVFNLNDKSLLYQKNDESRHRVRVPWGRDRRVAVTLTADLRNSGVFTVKFLAPPPEQAGRAFGYDVNRALEALAEGESKKAESLLRDAVRAEEDQGVALLLLAGLAKEKGEPERAAGLLEQAVRHPMPDELADVRKELERQLAKVLKRPGWLIEADRLVADGEIAQAGDLLADVLKDKGDSLTDWESSELHRRMGLAAHAAADLFSAQEHFDRALDAAQSTRQRALCMHRMGILQRDIGNTHQARQALRMARELGLPIELDSEAAAQLAALEAMDR